MRGALLLIALLFADPAVALTSDEVWAEWQAGSLPMSAGSRRDIAGGFVIPDLTLSGPSGLMLVVSNVTFSDLPGGQVSVKIDGPVALRERFVDTPFATLKSDAAVLTVSDNGGLRKYVLGAARIDLVSADRAVAQNLSLSSVRAVYDEQGGDGDRLTIGFTSDEIHYSGSGGTKTQDLTLPGVDLQVQVAAPSGVLQDAALTVEGAFQKGLALTGSLVNGPMVAHMTADAGTLTEQGLGCKITFQMDKDDFAARADCGAGEVLDKRISVADPIIVTLGQVQVQVTGPVNSLAHPRNLNVLFALRDVQANAAFWTKTDPKAALPHDAMGLALDLGLLTRWDIFAGRPGADFRPEVVDLRQFDLNLAGMVASFQGQGTVDPAGSADAPFKEAVLDGKITGFNRLLNAVVDAGFVGAGDLFPLRAGMAMMFNSRQGDDVLTTHVEAKPDGSVFVNGVQMR